MSICDSQVSYRSVSFLGSMTENMHLKGGVKGILDSISFAAQAAVSPTWQHSPFINIWGGTHAVYSFKGNEAEVDLWAAGVLGET